MKLKKRALLTLSAFLMLSSLSACAPKKTEDTSKKEETKIETAKTEDVEAALKDGKTIVLDARSNDAYNGWALDGAKRGGHIKGASDFSAKWLSSDYDEKGNLEAYSREQVLKDAMKNKNLTKDSKVIVYDTNDKDAMAVAQYLSGKGIKDIKIYNAKEWIDGEKELASYKNYHLLVAPSIVKSIVDGKTPEGFTTAKDIKVVDVRWGGNKESGYLQGHVPTAIHINTDDIEPPKKTKKGDTEWMLADDKALVKLLLDNGITSSDCVIATSPEPMAAARFAVVCKYLGVKDVRIMNGGLVGWSSNGYELATKEETPKKASDFGVTAPQNPALIDTMEEAKAMLENKDKNVLVDNRTIGEYQGKVTGYSYHKKKGRIPGAVYGHAGIKNSSSMYYYRNIDKTMRNAQEIEELWKKDGIDTAKHLSFMCGSGWRASEILWYSMVMGMENTSLYSDGWIGWSNSGLPTEAGDNK